ncbi:MAG: hypothetical protein U0744_15520 [Gemmataceae bacterium]
MPCDQLAPATASSAPISSGISTSAQPDYLLDRIVLPEMESAPLKATTRPHRRRARHRDCGIMQLVAEKSVSRDRRRGRRYEPTASRRDQRCRHRQASTALTDAVVDLIASSPKSGKPGPFGVSHVPVARRWQVMANPPVSLQSLNAKTLGNTLQQDASLPWSSYYSRIAGDVPLGEIAKSPGIIFLRTQIEVITPGKIGLRIGSAEGVQMWANEVPIEAAARTTLDLPRGMHAITIRIDVDRKTEGLMRCELFDIPQGGQARFVSQPK